MLHRDGIVIVALVAVLVALGGAVAAPGFAPPPAPTPTPAPAVSYVIRQGIVGRPSSVTPVTARTQADRDLVALLFRGLVRPGPDGLPVADLARSWKVEQKGARWTFVLRPDARWQDGQPVTSADVVFTVRVLQDPAYDGPLAAGWKGVTATAVDARTVRFDLSDPQAGFLQAATQPLLPAHLLRDTPADEIATSPFAQAPVGNGPLALEELGQDEAILVPIVEVASVGPLSTQAPVPATAGQPYAERIELRFYATADDLEKAYAAGEVDMASGLPPAVAARLASQPASRLIRYPATTLTGIVLNLRPGKFLFDDRRARTGLLAAIDRSALLANAAAGIGSRADSLIPPTSWAYNPAAAGSVAYSPTAATSVLSAGGWKKGPDGWIAPHATAPAPIELLAPEAAVNPVANAAAQQVKAAWEAIGLEVTLVELPAGEFVDRLRGGRFTAAVADLNIGLDPDLTPLLASSQVLAGGSNVSGLQDQSLDKALAATRVYGSQAARKKAFAELQKVLAASQPILPLFYRDATMVSSEGVTGPSPRMVSDGSQRLFDVVTWRVAGR